MNVDLTSLIWSVTSPRPSSVLAVSAALRNSRTPLPSDRPICGRPLGPEDEQREDEDDDDLGGADAHGGVTSVGVSVPLHRTSARPEVQRGPPARRRESAAAAAGLGALHGNTCKSASDAYTPTGFERGLLLPEGALVQYARRPGAPRGGVAGVVTYRDDECIPHRLALCLALHRRRSGAGRRHPALLQAHQPEPPHAGEAAALRVRHPAGRQPLAAVRGALLRLRSPLPRLRRGVGLPVPVGARLPRRSAPRGSSRCCCSSPCSPSGSCTPGARGPSSGHE